MNFDPNPLFYKMCQLFSDNYSEEHKVEIYNEGSSRCFGPETLIITINGPVKITDIKMGDMVRTFNEKDGCVEFKPIDDVLSFNNKKASYKITLKNGDVINATQDHEFYYEGSWRTLKHIVSLWNEKRNINKR